MQVSPEKNAYWNVDLGWEEVNGVPPCRGKACERVDDYYYQKLAHHLIS
jgi:hypothetical protein